MADPVPLTPFVGALAGEVRARLLALLGPNADEVAAFALAPLPLPPLVSAGEAGSGQPGWTAELRIRHPDGDFVIDIFDPRAHRDAWFRTGHLAWSYRSRGGNDPFARPSAAAWLKSLRERVTKADPAGAEPPATAALLGALRRYLPFAPVTDASYRHVLASRGGTGILWLGFRCNQDCGLCWQGRDWPEPPVEQFHRWLDEFAAAGLKNLILSGGEPTLHPALLPLLERARHARMWVVLETNGLRLVAADFRRRLVEAGLGEVFVSLHSGDPALSDAITRAPGTHATTVAAIDACIGDGIPVGIQCVIDRRNHATVDAHARFLVERFVAPHRSAGGRGLRRVTYSFPTNYFDGELYRRSVAPFDEVRPRLGAAVATLRAAGVEVSFLGMSGFPVCIVDGARDEMRALPEVTPEAQGDRRYAAACERCSARPRCLGVPAVYLDVFGERGLVPVAAPA